MYQEDRSKQMARRGLFIVFEGCDGTGKTTNIMRLEQVLRRRGFHVVTTREPGGTAIGEKIRDILLDTRHRTMCMRTEALLYAASRAQLVNDVIAPALRNGKVVICERYFYSSIAYQGVAGGLGNFIKTLNEWATQEIRPDIVVLLDMDPESSLGRRHERPDRIESRSADYHRAVRGAFLEIARAEPDRFTIVDASKPFDEVYEQIERRVLLALEQLTSDSGVR